MEPVSFQRVTFLIEGTEERLVCMLNPNNLVMRRNAGIKSLESVGGFVTGNIMADAPLLYTNGGNTELTLDLLFDVTIPGSSITSQDVRDLTRPFWNLSENIPDDNAELPVRLCRLMWGLSWNFLGVVTSVAERLEYFTPDGYPRRSWLRMTLRRVEDTTTAWEDPFEVSPESLPESPVELPATAESSVREMIAEEGSLLRIDQIANEAGISDRQWRSLAEQYGIENPLQPLVQESESMTVTT